MPSPSTAMRSSIWDFHLIENLARGGDGFDEYGVLQWGMESGRRADCARAASGIRGTRRDVFTMPSTVRCGQWRPRPRSAPVARRAGEIDFADYALADQLARSVVGFHDFADEFVAGVPENP